MLLIFQGVSFILSNPCNCSVLNQKVRGSSIVVEANLHLAVKLQPDLNIRAILYVASILRIKLKLT